jgi:quercetin dioxygenase-like cupin family protein
VIYTRIYSDSDGETHFADAEVALSELAYAPPAPAFLVSDAERAEAVMMTILPAGWVGGRHPTPRLQWFVQLAGVVEVETSDGEKRRFVAGSLIRVEDTTGRGHVTRVLGDVDVCAVFVQLPGGGEPRNQ